MKFKSLFQLSAIARLSLGLTALIISLVMITDIVLGVIPDQEKIERDQRRHFAEGLAIQLVALLETKNEQVLTKTLQEITIRNPDILSIGIRNREGVLLFNRGDHVRYWAPPESSRSTTNFLRVPIYSQQIHWGDIEISFTPKATSAIKKWVTSPTFLLIAILGLVGGSLIYVYMRRAIRYLDPSTAVPGRIRKVFDILKDSILVLDKNGHIVLANQSFRELSNNTHEELLGKKISALDFMKQVVRIVPESMLPWDMAFKNQTAITEERLTISRKTGGLPMEMIVSSEPISDDEMNIRGYLVTFTNMSELHQTNQKLRLALDELESSRAQMEKYNYELQLMASRDPLTGCLNRRAFFEKVEDIFATAMQGNKELFCIMADIDFFKSFNDLYGHTVGDQVIQVVAKIFNSNLRPTDLLCRYGGEEFCIMLTNLTIKDVSQVCERMRSDIEETGSASIRNMDVKTITMSFGIASLSDGASTITELIDRADSALYASKKSGRNRVTIWNRSDF